MRRLQPKRSVIEAMELPDILYMQDNLYAVSFSLMKLLPARFMLDRARDAGLVEPGSLVIETTSGTFGLALAIICAVRGYRLILVSDPAIDTPLQQRLEDLGAQVEIVREAAPNGGYQRARLNRMLEIGRQNPQHFCPGQYYNPHNWGAYAPVAELLAETMGEVDCIVGTVGSGGSVCGTSIFLRKLYPNLHVVGVDTDGSMLFGRPDKKRLLRGLGNSLMPKNLDHAAFDEVHWVTAAEAFAATRYLHRRHALFMGGTSGAAYLVARWWAAQNPHARVAVLLPDQGYRYQSTIYDDRWLLEQRVLLDQLPEHPTPVDHPEVDPGCWSYMKWRRRRYEEVMGRTIKRVEGLDL